MHQLLYTIIMQPEEEILQAINVWRVLNFFLLQDVAQCSLCQGTLSCHILVLNIFITDNREDDDVHGLVGRGRREW